MRYVFIALLVLVILYIATCAATSGNDDPPLEHRWSIELPHSPERLWALMQDYDNWTQYAPMVVEVQVLHPGDERGNGLLRRVIYQMPLGRRGSALELVTDVRHARGYTYTMISDTPDNDQTGRLRLERLGPNRTRLHFEERYNLTAFPWRLFEKQIYGFINRKNEESMRSMSAWLTEHPQYRPDLVEP
jgi:ribosome-associated toxin RatA of RatAB toxin-antitoxin module